MATVPLSGTNIRLLSGVPFSNDYKYTRWFDNQTDQTNYFLGKNVVHSMSQATYQRIEGYNFVAVNESIDDLWGANYLMFQNASYNSKWFYAFITKLEYKHPKLTYVHFQIDVFQTWKFSMTFKPSFVVREHCKLWNTDGTPVINTVDEGLNYGSDYDVVDVQNYRPIDGLYFLVIVCKQTMHYETATDNEILPSINGSPQPLCYYVHPFTRDDKILGVNTGSDVDGLNPVLEVLKGIYKNTDAVNNVVALYVTDYIGANVSYDGLNEVTMPGSQFMNALIHDGTTNFSTVFCKELPTYLAKEKTFGDKYAYYKPVKESKLLMYPYTTLILDDMKGNRKAFKNEYIVGNDIKISATGSLGTSNKMAYTILDYLIKADLGLSDQFPANLENSVISNNPNDVPIITDMLSAYLQGNRNSLENQKNSIIFNGVFDTLSGVAGGAATGAAMGGGAGAVAGGIIGGVKGGGNTVLQLQGMQAKQADINNMPPSLVKMGGNTNYDYGNGLTGLYIIRKQIKDEYIKKLEHFFNMFGYKVNEVKIPNFHTRQYWNYVQTTSCIITGNFNNEDLNELKAIFDNGITFWHTDDIGNYSLENEVI